MLRLRRFLLVPLDAALILLSGFFSLWLRDVSEFEQYVFFRGNLIAVMPSVLVLTVAAFGIFGLYRSLWEFASITELMRIFGANSAFLGIVLSLCTLTQQPLPRSVYIMWFMLALLSTGALRISFRLYRRAKSGTVGELKQLLSLFSHRAYSRHGTRVMIVGAGEAGSSAIREYGEAAQLVCAVDDDPRKRNMLINGVRVMGDRNDIPRLVSSLGITEIIVAIPTARRREQAAILNICNSTGAKLKLLPSTNELITGQVTVQRIRDVNIEDLLGRDEAQLDTASISEYIAGKTVLVTGGGGSIGSELCRQISRFNPEQLIVLDISENNMYLLQHELRAKSGLELVALVGSVRDEARLEQVFTAYKPQVVFHAAAHKHVPLMEASPSESVKNNVIGTYLTARAAINAGVCKFVLISTDKAVNPANVMGATKRMAELVIQGLNTCQDATEFVAVRFGNVLGSDGSVLPIFRAQIERGGPLTLTHPEITRYFMSIPEAAQLVLQAGALATGGEIFILDMGQPIKIIDLVFNLIRLSGMEPEVDIPIKITGLRPGEKLYEELLTDEEGISATRHEKIFVGKSAHVDIKTLEAQLNALRIAADAGDDKQVVALLKADIPTYQTEDRE